MVYNNVLELIGNTPMIKISKLTDDNMANVYVKLESFNPGGSIKDRPAYNMIVEKENKKELKNGYTIVEPTSGNTGIGIAMVCACRGYKCVFVMPETMSIERRKILSAYGAEIVLTDGKLGMSGAIEKAKQLVNENENYIILSQFENEDNANAHKKTTALEILNELENNNITSIDAFVASVGTGGTISGTGSILKNKLEDIKIIAVEPRGSAVLSGQKSGVHKIQGIGAGFVPSILDAKVIDEVITVSNEDAYDMARKMASKEGIFVGISSGANIYVAIEIAKKLGKGKNVITVAPDTGERYLSVDKLF